MQKTKKIYIDASIRIADKLRKHLERDQSIHVQIINIMPGTFLQEPADAYQTVMLIMSYRHDLESMDNIRRLRQYVPSLLCLLLMQDDDREYMVDLLELGVNGFVFESSALCVINDSIDQVLQGGMPITPYLAKHLYNGWQEKTMLNMQCLQLLTIRETEIMKNLAKGHLYKEIAYNLNISVLTVKNHLKNIYRKIGVTNRSEAIVKFLGR